MELENGHTSLGRIPTIVSHLKSIFINVKMHKLNELYVPAQINTACINITGSVYIWL